MTERKILVSEEYHPEGRTVVVDGIPALEATMGEETRVLFDADVFDRVYVLVERALVASDARELSITFTPSDAVAAG